MRRCPHNLVWGSLQLVVLPDRPLLCSLLLLDIRFLPGGAAAAVAAVAAVFLDRADNTATDKISWDTVITIEKPYFKVEIGA